MVVEKGDLMCVTPSRESGSNHVTVEDAEWEEAMNEVKKSVKRKLVKLFDKDSNMKDLVIS